MPEYPEGERQPTRASEEFLAYFFRIQRRVHVYELITTI
jgi:hypothetical protein